MAIDGWCIVAQIARPERAMRFIPLMTVDAADKSKPEVGSSKKITLGFFKVAFSARSERRQKGLTNKLLNGFVRSRVDALQQLFSQGPTHGISRKTGPATNGMMS